MIRNLVRQIENMSIRTRLVLLMVLFGAAVLVNILALVFLARSMSASLEIIEAVRVRQLADVGMHEELRNAEAALYRYYLDGEAGFAAQFQDQIQRFGQSVDTYQSLASSADGQRWAGQLSRARQEVQTLGQELIQLHDEQGADLAAMFAVRAQLSELFKPFSAQHPAEPAYQGALTAMNESAEAVVLAVTTYLANPDVAARERFTEDTINFQRQLGELRRAASGSSDELKSANDIDAAFVHLQSVGAQLISNRDRQQALFARTFAVFFEAGQQVIVGQIQPQEAQKLSEAQQSLRDAVASAILISLVVPLLMTLLAGILAARLAGGMGQNILALLRGADRVAAGNLGEPVRVTTADELMALAEAFNKMMNDLATRERGLNARLAELETLRQVSLQITSTLDLDRVLDSIANSVLGLVQATRVRIFTRGAGEHELQLVASAGLAAGSEPPEARSEVKEAGSKRRRARGRGQRAGDKPRGASDDAQATRGERQGAKREAVEASEMAARPDSLVALVAASGQPHSVQGAERAPFHDEDGGGASRPAPSSAGFPLKLGEQVLGVLHISSETRKSFTIEDVRIVALLADQAAVALGNARLYKSLAEREERVRSLMEKMAQIQDEERRLIGLDLHDGLTQIVISAHMHLNTLSAMMAENASARTQQELETSRALIKRAIEEARRVIGELRPTVVEDFGLAEGLRHYVTDVSATEGWQSEAQISLSDVKLSPPAETAIFRIAQEALSNARKYSGTRAIRVELLPTDASLQLTVQDWGRGFDLAALPDERDRFGLVGMHERARMLGGTCAIRSKPGQGTTVCVRMPLAALIEVSHGSER